MSTSSLIRQRLKDVLPIEIGVVGKNGLDAVTRADPADDHAYRETHAADAGLAANDFRVLSDSVELFHSRLA